MSTRSAYNIMHELIFEFQKINPNSGEINQYQHRRAVSDRKEIIPAWRIVEFGRGNQTCRQFWNWIYWKEGRNLEFSEEDLLLRLQDEIMSDGLLSYPAEMRYFRNNHYMIRCGLIFVMRPTSYINGYIYSSIQFVSTQRLHDPGLVLVPRTLIESD